MAALAVRLGDVVATATFSQPCGGRRMLPAAVVAVVLLCCLLPQVAGAAGGFRESRVEPPTPVCPESPLRRPECQAIRVPLVPANSLNAVGPTVEGSGVNGGYTPAEIRAAYKIPGIGGSGQTVAVVDPYNDPDIESNLKTYREKYGLPECTKATKCFNVVNQAGEAEPLPKESKEGKGEKEEEEEGWGYETSLDVAMVSAACPECKILLVEAENNGWENLGKAEDAAAANKAVSVISDSWVGKEVESYAAKYGSYFKHEKLPITAASGDSGYGVGFPAGSPGVIAVGGTALKKEPKSERGWVEEVWRDTAIEVGKKGAGTGSGCAFKGEEKPKWQKDEGCANRTDNDVAAVAAGNTPVSFYDHFGYKGWENADGTSVATPIVAGFEALAEKSVRELGAEIFYDKPKHEFEVTTGSDGTCTPEYLCTAGKKYNGPAGMGALDGVPTLGPAATTGSATNISEKEATVHGKVNPEGIETKYYFEYGTTEKYGVKTAEASAGSGTSEVEVNKTITGLTVNTKYYYRIVAANSKGTTDVSGQMLCTRWCLQEPPLPEGASAVGNRLAGVSCISSTECMAVGEGYVEGPGKAVFASAERWNGIEWSIQKPQLPAENGSTLHGISCTSATSCVAAGWFKNNSGTRVPLGEVWNGAEWTDQQPTAAKEALASYLGAVSCVSSAECMAVGEFEGTTKWLPFTERWNGKEWSLQEPPAPKGGGLAGVACTSSTDCIAAGWSRNSAEKTVPLIEAWNGKEWTAQEVPSPKEASGNGSLGSVSCTSASECIAVGSFEKSGKVAPFAEKWNGKEWSVQELPLPTGATAYTELYGVACASSAECVAVGFFDNGAYVPLAERWNGKEWSVQEPQDPKETTEAIAEGISCTASAVCTAVGFSKSDAGADHLLAELYD
jgi:Subtilase family